jgi:hypothetical protein
VGYVNFNTLSDNRYHALEETRRLLGFKKSQWKSLLSALSKTDNGWFEFKQGDFRITLEKFVEIDELHMEIKLDRNNVVKTLDYRYDLREFVEKRLAIPMDCNGK